MALIALGVTGGIGAYKAVEVARLLQKRGHEVVAVMTRAATKFVGPLTFEAITRRPVITSQFARHAPTTGASAEIEHISIADGAAVLAIVPCTANVLAKMAHGIADDFLTSLYLATKAPVVVAPAMNVNMWSHPAVEQNVRILNARGVRFVEPGEGYLACGWMGKGRLAEPEAIVVAVEAALTPVASSLNGQRVLVTAGPTYEDIDPVRYVGNRSSGRMGFALAEEAARRGARVTLVAGPTRLVVPVVDHVVRVRSAAEMHAAVTREAREADVVIMAAAVADYTPGETAPQKVAKSDGPLSLTLVRTRDILAELGAGRASAGSERPLLVGFAAETEHVVEKAREKRRRKQVDLIVANDVSRSDRGFDAHTNAVTIVGAAGETVVPLQAKGRVAAAILDAVEGLVAHPTGVGRP
jgi:phosphopantothenoylcysteine decarboxylase/phosphopantothenate--cysteine ligase